MKKFIYRFKFFEKFDVKNCLVIFYSFFYRLFIGLPSVIIGFFNDRALLLKSSTDIVIRDIKDYGIHIFQKPLKEDEIKILLNDFEELKKTNLIGQHGQLKGRIYQEGILTPLLGKYVKKIKPYIVEFLDTEKVNVEISYYQESLPCNDLTEIPGGEFHVDDNRANLKYFIYLTDVEEKNGPFCCIPATGTWRLKRSLMRGIMWELTNYRKYLYEFLINHESFEKGEKLILGKKGTHFLVDTTTLHRAKPVVQGVRKVAVISFNRSSLI